MWRKVGVPLPSGYAQCQTVMLWAQKTNRWTLHEPSLGALVLYGKEGMAHHIGVVVRIKPLVLSVEGNTTLEPGYDRNGIIVALKQLIPSKPLLGFAHLQSFT